jgi:S-adenosylmethionine:tRNA ribosyltransferase-isomerase
MKVSDFDFDLPSDLIAQEPAARRDGSRLLVLHPDGRLEHRRFPDVVEHLRDRLVYVNETRVLRARVALTRSTGGKVEALLLRRREPRRWEALLDARGKLRVGERLSWGEGAAVVLADREPDHWILDFDAEPDLDRVGRPPLPPYLKREPRPEDDERYQTVYARHDGSIAAPTAGLHFTPEILARLRIRRLTLHVGVGTFKPVRCEDVRDHVMHPELYEIPEPPEGRVAAVGTTTCRTLETWARTGRRSGSSDLFIHPPFEFKVVDALVTNFHLPRSTLLMLVCAFAGRERILDAYREAVRRRYRFFSYGDAMLLLR